MKNWTYYLLPIYWPIWLIVGFFYLLAQLPYRCQIFLGKKLGRLIGRYSKKSRHIARINLELCFPELSIEARNKLLIESFENIGIAIFETCLGFWGRKSQLKNLLHYHNKEHLEKAAASGRGTILLGAHFTTIEIIGRLVAPDFKFSVMYRPHKIGILNFIIERALSKHYHRAIPRQDVRQMLRSLEEGDIVWYSADVNAKPHQSVFAPFFGIMAATTKAPMRFTELTHCLVIPTRHFRREDGSGYDVYFEAPLENFPSGDYEKDATRVNQIIEAAVRENPAQYLWQYMRFKTRPTGEKRFYKMK